MKATKSQRMVAFGLGLTCLILTYWNLCLFFIDGYRSCGVIGLAAWAMGTVLVVASIKPDREVKQ